MPKDDKYYKLADQEDYEAQLSSRTEIISKTFVTDLWMKVLHRAIDDIVMFEIMRQDGVELNQEQLELESSAHGFLFDDNYRIPMSDYKIIIKCMSCGISYLDNMSIFSSDQSVCVSCKFIQNEKETDYYILDGQNVKDISLAELLATWNIADIKGFREGVYKRIDELIDKKRKIAKIRADSNKNKKGKNMSKKKTEVAENFITVTEEQLSNFDKGVIKYSNELVALLMSKNRKYGNSATNPVRAFSKASAIEQIKVRIDDKISRLVRSNSDEEDEDVIQDLNGYLTILGALQKGYIK